ncbi:MAG: gamma-glutamyl-gamma-aminobutyrate hydrolase family protein [Acidobacteriota bacterium]
MPRIAVAWPQPDYLTSLERAGATPRVLNPAVDRVPDVLDECDGVLLTGGADVDPVHYGAEDRHPALKLDAVRDAYEIVLAREAIARDMPLLAICRGVQLLNVAAGGTLVQDLPTHRPSDIVHGQREPATSTPHTVRIQGGSALATLIGPRAAHDVAVNSRHHQSVDRVAPGFVVSAMAPDGVVEGIERPGACFCVGVQWHPENFWETGEFSSMFTGLVDAAKRRAAR